MVAIHLVVVGALSITLDKARLYILSGMIIGPIENIRVYNINAVGRITDIR